MALVLSNVKQLLQSLRNNDWYITAFQFCFNNHNYVVVFEDLRELNRGTQYYAVMLTFIDINNEERIFETYANSYQFSQSRDEIIRFFEIKVGNNRGKIPEWGLYEAFNSMMPSGYNPLEHRYDNFVINTIEKRVNNEGLCCYLARHNGKKQNGGQIYRSGINTSKTKLLRGTLFRRLGNDKTISFCYRKENELSDAEIILNFTKEGNCIH